MDGIIKNNISLVERMSSSSSSSSGNRISSRNSAEISSSTSTSSSSLPLHLLESISSPSYSCPYCSHSSFTGEGDLEKHTFDNHALKHLAHLNLLPKGFTTRRLETGIRNLRLDKRLERYSNGNIKHECTVCYKPLYSASLQRMHFLACHLSHVISCSRPGRQRGPVSRLVSKTRHCEYCKAWIQSSKHLRMHQITAHAFQFFGKRLPRRCTSKGLDKAVEIVIQDCFVEVTGCKETGEPGTKYLKRYKCTLCSETKAASRNRLHVLSCHFGEVLRRLKSCPTLLFRECDSEEGPVPQEVGGGNGNPDGSTSNNSTSVLLEEMEEPEQKPVVLQEVVLDTTLPETEVSIKSEPMVEAIIKTEPVEANIKIKIEPLEANIKIEPEPMAEEFEQFDDPTEPTSSSSSSRSEPIICQYCSKTFSVTNSLNQHLGNVHAKEVFSEFIPPGTSTNLLKYSLEKHYNGRHESGGGQRARVRKYKCNYCKTAYSRLHEMYVHLSRSHLQQVLAELEVTGKELGDVDKALNKNPFSCPVPACGVRFLARKSMYDHIAKSHGLCRYAQIISQSQRK